MVIQYKVFYCLYTDRRLTRKNDPFYNKLERLLLFRKIRSNTYMVLITVIWVDM